MDALKFSKNGKGKNRRGALSLEMMGVISIIAMLVMSGLYYLNIMMRDTKVNDALANMQLINTKVNELFTNESDFNGLTPALFIKSGNAPTSIVSGTNRDKLKSPWGDMDLAPADDDMAFALTFEDVPGDVCQRLGSALRGSTAWASVSTGSGTYEFVGSDGSVNSENMTTWLSENCKDSGNTMVFTSRRQ